MFSRVIHVVALSVFHFLQLELQIGLTLSSLRNEVISNMPFSDGEEEKKKIHSANYNNLTAAR